MSKINAENRKIWNTNADAWNARMGEAGNDWHLELVAPSTTELLGLKKGDTLLDIGCGNGIFARRMQATGVQVTAFDFAECNIEHAKSYPDAGVDYRVLDAINYDALCALGEAQFDAAVANMVLMDVPEIEPLFRALAVILKPHGRFVFSISHPCFHTEHTEKLEDSIVVHKYEKSEVTKGWAVKDQPYLQYFFERSISTYFNAAFKHGFVIDGLQEPVFDERHGGIFTKIPPVLIVRMKL